MSASKFACMNACTYQTLVLAFGLLSFSFDAYFRFASLAPSCAYFNLSKAEMAEWRKNLKA